MANRAPDGDSQHEWWFTDSFALADRIAVVIARKHFTTEVQGHVGDRWNLVGGR